MCKSKIFTLLVFLVLALVSANSHLTEINSQFFSTQILPTKSLWLIFTTKQSASEKIQTLNQVAEITRGIFRLGIRQVVGGKFEQGDLHLYEDDRDEPIEYSGKFTTEQIIDFVLSNFDKVVSVRSKAAKSLKDQQQFQTKEAERAEKEWKDEQELRKKSDSILLNHQNWDVFIQGRDAFLVNFFEANCSACIELNKEWQAVASELKGQVKVAKINITEELNDKLEEQLQIQRYPTIRFYAKGNKKVTEFSLYDGVHKKFSIKEWVIAKLSEKIEKASIPQLNKQNYETLCKSGKATCVIFFLQQGQSETLPKIEALQAKHLSKPISFLVARKGQQKAFEKQVEVSKYPDVVMMFCKRKQIWHQGGLDLSAVDQTINEISLGNRLGFNKYTFTEEIV